jgi:N-methylhydantoinase A
MIVIGVDVGGTFTDIVMLNTETGEQHIHKVSSTPQHQEQAVLRGFNEILERHRVDPQQVSSVVHGTTVATNAMLQRTGARVCLVTTMGFEDVLEIGRQNRSDIYNVFADRPKPLVARSDRIGVKERLDWLGESIEPLTGEEISRVTNTLEKLEPEAIAISFLFSYKTPVHEKQILQAISASTSSYVVASSDVLPEFREYERTSTTVLEAYLGPLVLEYLARLGAEISNVCPWARLNVMQSNGGTSLYSRLNGRAMALAISGLAGGVMGGWHIAQRAGISKALTLDMGGTSCDISAVVDSIVVRPENEVAGLPLRFPSVDVKTIGAGGGSNAWIDDASVLHVGPQSAGANPGPACYGFGGQTATVTDATLLLGRLNPEFFVGGEIRLQPALAEKAIEELAEKLALSTEETAAGIIRISTSNMVQAIREVTIERGLDPREFVLVAFGGAGPTQGADIARSLAIDSILIPRFPGITSAFGLVCADLRVDLMRSVVLVAESRNSSVFQSVSKELVEEAKRRLLEQGADDADIEVKKQVDMRYKGQSHELPIDLPIASEDVLSQSIEIFAAKHKMQYGYNLPDREMEWVTVRVTAAAPQLSKTPSIQHVPSSQVETSEREVILADGSRTPAVVFRRQNIPDGVRIHGPAIIEQIDTTTWIDRGWFALREPSGVLWLRREKT